MAASTIHSPRAQLCPPSVSQWNGENRVAADGDICHPPGMPGASAPPLVTRKAVGDSEAASTIPPHTWCNSTTADGPPGERRREEEGERRAEGCDDTRERPKPAKTTASVCLPAPRHKGQVCQPCEWRSHDQQPAKKAMVSRARRTLTSDHSRTDERRARPRGGRRR